MKINKSSHKLQGFGGANIPVKGEVILTCKHKRDLYKIKFQVVDLNHRPLLSVKACSTLGLVNFCNTITNNGTTKTSNNKGSNLDKLLDKYGDIFEGYGCLPGEVELEIDDTITPNIQPARRIP